VRSLNIAAALSAPTRARQLSEICNSLQREHSR